MLVICYYKQNSFQVLCFQLLERLFLNSIYFIVLTSGEQSHIWTCWLACSQCPPGTWSSPASEGSGSCMGCPPGQYMSRKSTSGSSPYWDCSYVRSTFTKSCLNPHWIRKCHKTKSFYNCQQVLPFTRYWDALRQPLQNIILVYIIWDGTFCLNNHAALPALSNMLMGTLWQCELGTYQDESNKESCKAVSNLTSYLQHNKYLHVSGLKLMYVHEEPGIMLDWSKRTHAMSDYLTFHPWTLAWCAVSCRHQSYNNWPHFVWELWLHENLWAMQPSEWSDYTPGRVVCA